MNCPAGSYQNDVLSKCIPCPKNTFQNNEAQTKCTKCPPSSSTRQEYGAKSLSDCKGSLVPLFLRR